MYSISTLLDWNGRCLCASPKMLDSNVCHLWSLTHLPTYIFSHDTSHLLPSLHARGVYIQQVDRQSDESASAFHISKVMHSTCVCLWAWSQTNVVEERNMLQISLSHWCCVMHDPNYTYLLMTLTVCQTLTPRLSPGETGWGLPMWSNLSDASSHLDAHKALASQHSARSGGRAQGLWFINPESLNEVVIIIFFIFYVFRRKMK